MNTQQVKNIIESTSDIAFIIGNGINRYFGNNAISWENLLLELWNENNGNTQQQTSIPRGVSFTEFYDALLIKNFTKKDFTAELQKSVQKKMSVWVPIENGLKSILNKIKSKNAPVLTTNFDDLIPKSLHLEFRKLEEKGFTDFYPWSCYYSDMQVNNPSKNFGVWYPNGMIKYHRSIKLGLSQYMGSVSRARKLIHKDVERIEFTGKNQNYWEGFKTWLHIIFNNSLFIFGLGLEESEVFIRWLLIERAKYFKKFPKRRHKGWYIMKKKEKEEITEGKKFFFKSVGIDVIELNEYKNVYEDIWE
ncbi:hypothetical protein MROS_0900 [Melioribacter roseus P3M-2]|uniref:Uncharacterized protein n=1 Tax=Melioribacter roseus (strain DSM 23840 / JCM 17771 / VKM B-2668 / P3M-2) TaxID=1191523 RepID=I7A2I4_MELRP|nr:SIR2 family protein [Melioribacter roseus]AFN74141.1 hypothetical protein MROS_0900 [Melioribacter roseus P3M-2]